MTGLLMVVGVFVFFISVYGAVMVGGHLLEELELADQQPAPRPQSQEDDQRIAATAPPI
jgi:hypothetical protein